ncbi:MAG: ABC transporter substrate-binding protein [Phycisphaeraceae bacterium]|nr:ABC transporter substrate-binding protein [Phycisphaeraceae bacterium]
MLTQRRWIVLVCVMGVGLGLGFCVWQSNRPKSASAVVRQSDFQRIVSLSPSITECLFALGLGHRVVGVTNYCDYPAEALTKAKVGGYYDLSYEAVVALDPDLVIGLPSHEDKLADLEALGLSLLILDLQRVDTILASIETLGRVSGVPEPADRLVVGIRQRMAAVKARAINAQRPRVMITASRQLDSDRIDEIYIAGKGGFYDEMIVLAGGINAYQGDLPYPKLSGEGILRLRPDMVLDMVPDLAIKGISEASVLQQWASVPGLAAHEQGRVKLFTEDFVVIPGPRFIDTLEKMAEAIHPEGTKL